MRKYVMKRKAQSGFSLVELTVVIVVIGVLAAFAVPKFRNAVERSKAAEAFNYLSDIRSAQERFQAKEGTYSSKLSKLDTQMPSPKYFRVGSVRSGSSGNLQSSWKLTLTRKGASAGYGAYTVTFGQDGFIRNNSSIRNLPQINPMGN